MCRAGGTDFSGWLCRQNYLICAGHRASTKGIPSKGAKRIQINFPEVIWLYHVIQDMMDMDMVWEIL